MKTAISLPDELFHETERWTVTLGVSRSALIADALREHLARLEAESLTRRIDAAVDLAGDESRDVVAANRRRLARDAEDW